MSERAEFHVMGQPLDGQPLHYTASGLDYVYLKSGFKVEEDPKYGRMVTIQNVKDLHCAIGLYIISQPRKITGAEFRFLRKQMGFKQKELAEELGVNEQTVANYEKGKPIPINSENLMRLIFLLWMTPPDAHAEVLKRVAEHMGTRRRRTKGATEASIPPTDIQSSMSKLWQVQLGSEPIPICYIY